MPSETQEQGSGETESAKQNANASGAACPTGSDSQLGTRRPEQQKEKERVEGDTFSCSLSAVLLEPAGTDMTVIKILELFLRLLNFVTFRPRARPFT